MFSKVWAPSQSVDQLIIEDGPYQKKSPFPVFKPKIFFVVACFVMLAVVLYGASSFLEALWKVDRTGHFRVFCLVPYGKRNQKMLEEQPSLVNYLMQMHPQDYARSASEDGALLDGPQRRAIASSLEVFEQSFEFHETENVIERIRVRRFRHSSPAIWIHDRESGHTAIEDPYRGVCFVMDFESGAVLPSEDLLILANRLRQGNYVGLNMDLRTKYMVANPTPLDEKESINLGSLIYSACILKPIYTLIYLPNGTPPNLEDQCSWNSYVSFGGEATLQIVVTNLLDLAENFN